ncbi:MAG: L,D-transpeptidase [Solirubrobacterales bacterium]|nr:L,D-transpeptidase [Solirubrobacterales bacterium]
MRRHLASICAVLGTAVATLGLCAGAAAAISTGTMTAPSLAPAPAGQAAKKPPRPGRPKRKPTPGVHVHLFAFDAFFAARQTLTVPERALHITGVVSPYAPGQAVVVKAYLGHELISSHTLSVRPSRDRRDGRFIARVRAPRPGLLHVTVIHVATPRMPAFTATRTIASLRPHASPGDRGAFVALIQSQLAQLHFYIPQTGVYDLQTGLAIDAYHRLLHHGTSQALDGLTISELLDERGAFAVRYPQDGRHVEADLGSQVLALIVGSKVQALYPISSGKPSTPTILGRFHVYLREPGYNSEGMYYSDYFIRGYAIHGYDPAPDYAASHGCLRLPISDAISVWNWLSIGVGVDVYQ